MKKLRQYVSVTLLPATGVMDTALILRCLDWTYQVH
jgi:hypothetical protein